MKGAAKLLVKREVIEISDDEVESGLPLKAVKKEPQPPSPSPPLPTPSPNVVELQQRLEKTENMYQKACRAAREAELRAEQAETLLDCKNGILSDAGKEESLKDELENKLAIVSEQLKAAKAETESTVKKAIELSQLNRTLKEDFKRANWHEQEAKKKALELTNENLALKEELKGLKDKEEVENSANSAVNESSAACKQKYYKQSGIIREKYKEIKLINKTKTKIEKENVRLKDDLKLMKGYEELGKAANDKSSKLERENCALKEELEKMRGKEALMDTELKEARLALFCKNNIEKENQSFKEQLKLAKAKEEEADRKIAELELQKVAFWEYQQALMEGTAEKLAVGENTQELAMQNFLLKEESMASKRREESACKISVELSRENSVLRQELSKLREANGIANAEWPIQWTPRPLLSYFFPEMAHRFSSVQYNAPMEKAKNSMAASTIAKIGLRLPPVHFNTPPSEEPKIPDVMVKEEEIEDMEVEE
ncbi:hypothetical protein PRIPAC_83149 [Pristionchus pacificus]|nr:hypothetical protein PRIPAC_83149 [Pristionchus pacificus]